LRPGQTAGGSVAIKVISDAMAVPESAIVYDPKEQPFLFILNGVSYEPHQVKVGMVQDGWVEVVSGLEQGQPVVTQGAYELFNRQFKEQFKVQD
jgi:multidrug efflux pump subunit AcrA (membrane-fusion protein)